MSKTQEALKLALEALEWNLSVVEDWGMPNQLKMHNKATAAIYEALAKQEAVLPGGGHVPAVPVAVYGYCPECGGAGVMRERRPNGDDKCTNGHRYPSSKALAEQPAQPKEKADYAKGFVDGFEEGVKQMRPAQPCDHCGGFGDVSGEYPGVACPECNGSGTGSQPELIKHEVEQPYDWSEWVCPNPESYLMKCCDCGLVHEAQFRVAKYQPSPSDECEVVNDPDLLAQFRMRRSEQWSPKDMAYRPGGLPLAEQPAQLIKQGWDVDDLLDKPKQLAQQEPRESDAIARAIAWLDARDICSQPSVDEAIRNFLSDHTEDNAVAVVQAILNAAPQPSKPWVPLTEFDIDQIPYSCSHADSRLIAFAIEAKLREKNQ